MKLSKEKIEELKEIFRKAKARKALAVEQFSTYIRGDREDTGNSYQSISFEIEWLYSQCIICFESNKRNIRPVVNRNFELPFKVCLACAEGIRSIKQAYNDQIERDIKDLEEIEKEGKLTIL